jgi:hypothetical protein
VSRRQGGQTSGGDVPLSLTCHESRDSIADIWGPRTPHVGEWPERVDEATIDRPDR